MYVACLDILNAALKESAGWRQAHPAIGGAHYGANQNWAGGPAIVAALVMNGRFKTDADYVNH